MYGTFNFDEHPAQFQFNTLKIDKVSPVSIFIWKGRCCLYTSYNNKNEKIDSLSCKLHQYMPYNILILLIQLVFQYYFCQFKYVDLRVLAILQTPH